MRGEVPECRTSQSSFQKYLREISKSIYGTKLNLNCISGDWHRYNLKRKVAGLPVVSLEAFEERKTAHEKDAKNAENLDKQGKYYCVVSGKSFKNLKTYENHLLSKKYLEMVAKFKDKPAQTPLPPDSEGEEEEDDEEIEEVDSDEWEDEPIDVTECLFSGYQSSSMEKNLKYMSVHHSFFLPDAEYITDLEGLLRYLGAKVNIKWQFSPQYLYSLFKDCYLKVCKSH